MLNFKDDIVTKLKESMISKDSRGLSIYREIKSAVTLFEKDNPQTNLGEREFQVVIKKLLSQHEETKETLIKAGRTTEDEEFFMNVLNEYLPPVISDERTRIIVDDAIFSLGTPDKKKMGLVIKKAKEQIESLGFSADTAMIANLVKSILR
jgi:uncharacterized protein YqeY